MKLIEFYLMGLFALCCTELTDFKTRRVQQFRKNLVSAKRVTKRLASAQLPPTFTKQLYSLC